LIEHLTKQGELIIEPFAGAGRRGKIALKMGRRWIGSESYQAVMR
jgi:DNA modification methylase